MQPGSYVVQLVGCDDPNPFKHFCIHADAVDHGRRCVETGEAERAIIYAVADTSDARTAIAAVQMGKAEYIQTCSRHASETEIEDAKDRAFKAALQAGPQAVLKFLGLPKDPTDQSSQAGTSGQPSHNSRS